MAKIGRILGKIALAILACIGIIFIIDKIAGTTILDTIYSKFVDFLHWLQEAIT